MGRSVCDANGTLQKTKTRVIDSLNRLQQDIGGTTYAAAPTQAITQYGYDCCRRFKIDHVEGLAPTEY